MNDRTLLIFGRTLIGLSFTGIGIVHFLLPGLRPILAPVPAVDVWPVLGYGAGIILVVAGTLLIAARDVKITAGFLVVFFGLFFLFGHLPNRLRSHPEVLAYWTDALKLLSMVGVTLMLTVEPGVNSKFASVARSGKYLFAFMLAVFGVDHFLYVEHVHKMVPGWISGPRVWTYLTGLALFAAAIAIITKVMEKTAMKLLSAMLIIWLFMIHLPDTVNNPLGDAGILIGLLTCLCFIGVAMVLAGSTDSMNAVTKKIPPDEK